MATLLLVSALWVVLLLSLRRPLGRLDDEHAIAGRFGSNGREAVITAYAGRVLETAERIERLGSFERVLRLRAWSGTPFTITGRRGDWRSWTFADGERWRVRHTKPPTARDRRRVVVATTDGEHAEGLAVRAYVPGSHEIEMPIVDAIPRHEA